MKDRSLCKIFWQLFKDVGVFGHYLSQVIVARSTFLIIKPFIVTKSSCLSSPTPINKQRRMKKKNKKQKWNLNADSAER